MPVSSSIHITQCLARIRTLGPKSVLDVGCGFGLWGFLCRMHLDVWDGRIHPGQWRTRIDGIELFEPYIQAHQRALYSNLMIADIRDVVDTLEDYELIIAGDVIEHLDKTAGEAVLEKLYARAARALLVNIPIGPGWDHPEQYGNPGELHRSQWECSDFTHYPCEITLARFEFGDYGTFYCPKDLPASGHAQSWRTAAEWAESRGNLQEALICARHAHHLEPGDAGTALLLADLALKQDLKGEAVEVLQALLESQPDNPSTRYLLAHVLYMAHRPVEACQEVMKLLAAPEVDPAIREKTRQLAGHLGIQGGDTLEWR